MSRRAVHVAITWSETACAWHLVGEPAGPAGFATADVPGLMWRSDWSDPDLVVEAFVETVDDRRTGVIAGHVTELLTKACGEHVVRALHLAGEQPGRPISVELAETGRGVRHALGRLGRSTAELRWASGASWWSVERLWSVHQLDLERLDDIRPLLGEWVDDAFDLVDALPSSLVRAMVDEGLGPMIRHVMDAAHVPDAEMPFAIRLSNRQVRADLGEIERVGAPARTRVSLPVRRGADAARAALVAALSFMMPHRQTPVDGGAASGEAERGSIGIFDVAPGMVLEATWDCIGDLVSFRVLSMHSPWALDYFVHVVDSERPGSEPVVIPLASSGRRLAPDQVESVASVRRSELPEHPHFTLAQLESIELLDPQLLAVREAVSVSREGEHLAVAAWYGRPQLWSNGEDRWRQAAAAWAELGDVARARASLGEAARCRRHAHLGRRAATQRIGHRVRRRSRGDDERTSGITEHLVALVSSYAVVALDRLAAADVQGQAEQAADLEVLLDSVGQVEAARLAREVSDRARSGGIGGGDGP